MIRRSAPRCTTRSAVSAAASSPTTVMGFRKFCVTRTLASESTSVGGRGAFWAAARGASERQRANVATAALIIGLLHGKDGREEACGRKNDNVPAILTHPPRAAAAPPPSAPRAPGGSGRAP